MIDPSSKQESGTPEPAAAKSQESNAALVQATADLLAARNRLYELQPQSRLIAAADHALANLLAPIMVMWL